MSDYTYIPAGGPVANYIMENHVLSFVIGQTSLVRRYANMIAFRDILPDNRTHADLFTPFWPPCGGAG